MLLHKEKSESPKPTFVRIKKILNKLLLLNQRSGRVKCIKVVQA